MARSTQRQARTLIRHAANCRVVNRRGPHHTGFDLPGRSRDSRSARSWRGGNHGGEAGCCRVVTTTRWNWPWKTRSTASPFRQSRPVQWIPAQRAYKDCAGIAVDTSCTATPSQIMFCCFWPPTWRSTKRLLAATESGRVRRPSGIGSSDDKAPGGGKERAETLDVATPILFRHLFRRRERRPG